jgi:hypothetical protein
VQTVLPLPVLPLPVLPLPVLPLPVLPLPEPASQIGRTRIA